MRTSRSRCGADLNEYLQAVYGNFARFIVMFVSADYAAAAFPTLERRSAFAGAMHSSSTVLPVRFDDTELPGLNVNVSYLDARTRSPAQIAAAIAAKLQRAGVPLRRPSFGSMSSRARARTAEPFVVNVIDDIGEPVHDAEVAVAGENSVVIRGMPVGTGEYRCAAPAGRLMRLWIAHRRFRALLVADVDTSGDAFVRLGRAANIGSAVLFASTGYLPSIKGRFNPIVSGGGHHFVYIDNAAANGQAARPFVFDPGVPFEVEDQDGSTTVVTILDSTGNGSLLEYETVPAS